VSILCQLVLSSTKFFFSDENSEEKTEMNFDDIFDDEFQEDDFCYFDWLITYSNDSVLVNSKQNLSIFLLFKYLTVDLSIPVPPPEQIV
jgi:hypothetical protein